MSRSLLQRAFVAALALACVISGIRADYTETQLKADQKLFEDAKLPHGDADLIAFFRKRIPTKADLDRVEALVKNLASKSFKERDHASSEIEKEGPAALPILRRILKSNLELEVRRRTERCIKSIEDKSPSTQIAAAARLLGHRRAPDALAVLLEFLPLSPDEAIEEEIDGIVFNIGLTGSKLQFLPPEVKSGKVDPLLVQALHDKDPSRRGIAALTVASFGAPSQRDLAAKLLADDNPTVRLRTVQGLMLACDKAALPVAVELLKSAPMDVALQAEDLLSVVAREKTPDAPLGDTPELRDKCHAAWKEWWDKNNTSVDLSLVEIESPFGGLTARASKGAIHFVEAIQKSDIAAIKKVTDIPFTFAGMQNFRTRAELDSFLDVIGKQGAQPKINYKIDKVIPATEYIKHSGEGERAFLESARIAQVHVVYTQINEGPMPQRILIPFFIRVSGGRALCLGFGNPKQ